MKNGKVCIVAANNIRLSPYIFFYTRILDQNNIDYELVYPDRNRMEDEFNKKTYKISWDNRKPSLINYMIYTNKVKRIIRKEKYDKVIVLTSVIAVYMSLWLEKKYKQSYIVDIRDYTYEHIKPYALLEKKALKNAALRVISSEKFRLFLPDMEYLVCHNISMGAVASIPKWVKSTDIITIGYIGSLAYAENVKKLIELVNKDERFRFHIFGGGPDQEEIEKAVNKVHCERIGFHGPYKPEEKGAIIESTDVLFNIYGNGTMLLDCALSNKLYDAMFYRKIIMNSPGTYMEEISGLCGYSMNLNDESCLNDFYNYYMQLDEQQVTEYQDRMMKKFLCENQNVEKKIIEFLS